MKLCKSRHCLDHRSIFILQRSSEHSVSYDIPEINIIDFTNRKRMMVDQWKTMYRDYFITPTHDRYGIIGIPDEA